MLQVTHARSIVVVATSCMDLDIVTGDGRKADPIFSACTNGVVVQSLSSTSIIKSFSSRYED